jgi:hypothetical protein
LSFAGAPPPIEWDNRVTCACSHFSSVTLALFMRALHSSLFTHSLHSTLLTRSRSLTHSLHSLALPTLHHSLQLTRYLHSLSFVCSSPVTRITHFHSLTLTRASFLPPFSSWQVCATRGPPTRPTNTRREGCRGGSQVRRDRLRDARQRCNLGVSQSPAESSHWPHAVHHGAQRPSLHSGSLHRSPRVLLTGRRGHQRTWSRMH